MSVWCHADCPSPESFERRSTLGPPWIEQLLHSSLQPDTSQIDAYDQPERGRIRVSKQKILNHPPSILPLHYCGSHNLADGKKTCGEHQPTSEGGPRERNEGHYQRTPREHDDQPFGPLK